MGGLQLVTRSESATDARAAAYLTLGQFRMFHHHMRPMSHGPWMLIADEKSLALSAISNVVAHVELFVTLAVLKKSAREIQGLPPEAGKHLFALLTKEIEGTWDGRLRVLGEFSNVSVKRDWAGWQAWNGFVAARNAWAHGQGRLTRRQLNDKSLDASLKAAGLRRNGQFLSASAGAVERAVQLGTELIDLVDIAAG